MWQLYQHHGRYHIAKSYAAGGDLRAKRKRERERATQIEKDLVAFPLTRRILFQSRMQSTAVVDFASHPNTVLFSYDSSSSTNKMHRYISTHDAENIISFSWPCEGRHSPRRGERKAPQREERVLRRMHFEGRRRGIPAICSRDVRFAETLKLPLFGDPEFRSLRRPYLHTFADFVDFVMPRRDALQYHFVTAPPRPVPRGGVSCENQQNLSPIYSAVSTSCAIQDYGEEQKKKVTTSTCAVRSPTCRNELSVGGGNLSPPQLVLSHASTAKEST